MEVEAFVRILLTRDLSVASARVDALRMRGVPLDELCTRLLTPAARLLGEMWVEDLCEFTDVTLGLWRLQHVLREFSEAARDERRPAQRGLRILLVPTPGEQHSFGITMVGEVFRQAGWDVCGGVPATGRDLGELARSEWFDIVGISLASDRFVESVRTSIATVRRTSRNRAVGILAGGKAFAEDAGLGYEVGADTVVLDGHQAPLEAERTLSAIARVRR